MVLVKNDLNAVIIALDLAATTLWRIKLNYFWALCYNALLVPIAAGVLYPTFRVALAPMYAGAAMALSSVSIVLSSLLLVRYQPPISSSSSTSKAGGYQSAEPLSVGQQRCNCPVSTAQAVHDDPDQENGLLRKMKALLYSSWGRVFGFFRPSMAGVTAGATMGDYEQFARERFGSLSLRPAGGSGSALHVGLAAAARSDGSENERLLPLQLQQQYPQHSNSGQYGSASGITGTRAAYINSKATLQLGCGCGMANCRCGVGCRCGPALV